MNMKLLHTLVGLSISIVATAQQLPLLSQFQESAGVLNPASLSDLYFVYEHNLQFRGTHHSQWMDLEGRPQTSILSGQLLLDDYGPVVPHFGAYFIQDQTGPTGFTGLYGKFGGIITDDVYERGVSFAAQVGINQYRLRISELELRDAETVYAADDDGRIAPDAGLGVFAYQRLDNQLVTFGLSVPQVLGLDLSFRGEDGDIVTQRFRHYYAQAGYLLSLRDDAYLQIAAWLKVVPEVPAHASAVLRYQTPSAIYIGVGGTSAKALHGEGGIVIGDRSGASPVMRIGYGFDYSLASFGPYAGGTHEVNLSYSLNR